ncbi:MAG: HAD hydrolase-like protein [Eubacteriales bacterium]|nr:HAD hydrolase-like protein [Eubacteriales bacterium]
MGRFDNILFDLDGTLTDSGPGITKSVQHALRGMGIEENNLKNLERFIGPPLSNSFHEYYGLEGERNREAVIRFRKRYETIGLFENEPYPGIPELLRDAQAAGIRLAVASSKPEPTVIEILKHFDLAKYFTVIVGSDVRREMSGQPMTSDKAEIVGMALAGLCGAFLARTAMVGDRLYDMEGAREAGVHPVGVVYGYGSAAELRESGAEFLAEDVAALRRYLLGEE